jgi:hypothetical protein
MSAVLNFIRLQDLIDQNALQGKRVFIRADLNVPQDDAGNITEDTRIRASVPAIKAAAAAGAKVMVTSHLGRPTEGEFKPEDSLAPVAKRLSELLGQPVELKQNWVDGAGLEGLQAGQVVLLENVREQGRKEEQRRTGAENGRCATSTSTTLSAPPTAPKPPRTASPSSRRSPAPARCWPPSWTRWARRWAPPVRCWPSWLARKCRPS